MQIDRLVPTGPEQDSGTPAPPFGVEADTGAAVGDVTPRGVNAARATASRRAWLWVALGCLALLGQGERSTVDPRFTSPSATLRSYWQALRIGDADAAWECLVEGRHQPPWPGMLWFLPPTDELTLDEFRSLPVTGGRMLVSYQVRYRASGSGEVRSFRHADELVRTRGEWRIARPVGEVSMPEWQPIPHRVDT